MTRKQGFVVANRHAAPTGLIDSSHYQVNLIDAA